MKIIGMDKATYIYLSGISIKANIYLDDSLSILPVVKKLEIDTLAKVVKSDLDFAVAILASYTVSSQIKIVAQAPKDIAIIAWNTQWDLLLLSAIFNCQIDWCLQSSDPVESLSDQSSLHVTNYRHFGLATECYELSTEDIDWITHYYAYAKTLLENDQFVNAVHCLSSYRWHVVKKIQLAIIWTGIESLFNVSSEISFRLSLFIANFLSPYNKNVAKEIYSKVKKLYNHRSASVHGNKIKFDLDESIKESAILLNQIIRKCIEENILPNEDNLIFTK